MWLIFFGSLLASAQEIEAQEPLLPWMLFAGAHHSAWGCTTDDDFCGGGPGLHVGVSRDFTESLFALEIDADISRDDIAEHYGFDSTVMGATIVPMFKPGGERVQARLGLGLRADSYLVLPIIRLGVAVSLGERWRLMAHADGAPAGTSYNRPGVALGVRL